MRIIRSFIRDFGLICVGLLVAVAGIYWARIPLPPYQASTERISLQDNKLKIVDPGHTNIFE